MARQRQHTTPPQKRPYATAPAAATALPPKPRPRPSRVLRHAALPLLSGHSTCTSAVTRTRLAPTWHMAHQQFQHTTAPPMTSPRAAPASPLTGIDPPFSVERTVHPPGNAPDEDGTGPDTTGAAPPSAEFITSFLLPIRQRAAGVAADPLILLTPPASDDCSSRCRHGHRDWCLRRC